MSSVNHYLNQIVQFYDPFKLLTVYDNVGTPLTNLLPDKTIRESRLKLLTTAIQKLKDEVFTTSSVTPSDSFSSQLQILEGNFNQFKQTFERSTDSSPLDESLFRYANEMKAAAEGMLHTYKERARTKTPSIQLKTSAYEKKAQLLELDKVQSILQNDSLLSSDAELMKDIFKKTIEVAEKLVQRILKGEYGPQVRKQWLKNDPKFSERTYFLQLLCVDIARFQDSCFFDLEIFPESTLDADEQRDLNEKVQGLTKTLKTIDKETIIRYFSSKDLDAQLPEADSIGKLISFACKTIQAEYFTDILEVISLKTSPKDSHLIYIAFAFLFSDSTLSKTIIETIINPQAKESILPYIELLQSLIQEQDKDRRIRILDESSKKDFFSKLAPFFQILATSNFEVGLSLYELACQIKEKTAAQTLSVFLVPHVAKSDPDKALEMIKDIASPNVVFGITSKIVQVITSAIHAQKALAVLDQVLKSPLKEKIYHGFANILLDMVEAEGAVTSPIQRFSKISIDQNDSRVLIDQTSPIFSQFCKDSILGLSLSEALLLSLPIDREIYQALEDEYVIENCIHTLAQEGPVAAKDLFFHILFKVNDIYSMKNICGVLFEKSLPENYQQLFEVVTEFEKNEPFMQFYKKFRLARVLEVIETSENAQFQKFYKERYFLSYENAQQFTVNEATFFPYIHDNLIYDLFNAFQTKLFQTSNYKTTLPYNYIHEVFENLSDPYMKNLFVSNSASSIAQVPGKEHEALNLLTLLTDKEGFYTDAIVKIACNTVPHNFEFAYTIISTIANSSESEYAFVSLGDRLIAHMVNNKPIQFPLLWNRLDRILVKLPNLYCSMIKMLVKGLSSVEKIAEFIPDSIVTNPLLVKKTKDRVLSYNAFMYYYNEISKDRTKEIQNDALYLKKEVLPQILLKAQEIKSPVIFNALLLQIIHDLQAKEFSLAEELVKELRDSPEIAQKALAGIAEEISEKYPQDAIRIAKRVFIENTDIGIQCILSIFEDVAYENEDEAQLLLQMLEPIQEAYVEGLGLFIEILKEKSSDKLSVFEPVLDKILKTSVPI